MIAESIVYAANYERFGDSCEVFGANYEVFGTEL